MDKRLLASFLFFFLVIGTCLAVWHILNWSGLATLTITGKKEFAIYTDAWTDISSYDPSSSSYSKSHRITAGNSNSGTINLKFNYDFGCVDAVDECVDTNDCSVSCDHANGSTLTIPPSDTQVVQCTLSCLKFSCPQFCHLQGNLTAV